MSGIAAERGVNAIINELGTGTSEGLDPLEVVQSAVDMIAGMTNWFWMEGHAWLASVAGSNLVRLPADFGSIRRHANQDRYLRILPTDEFLEFERDGTSVLGGVYLARISDDESALEFVSDFTEDNERAFWVAYDRAIPVVESNATVLPLPPYMRVLFLNVCRKLARGWDEADDNIVEVLMNRIRQSEIYNAAVQNDIRKRIAGVRGGETASRAFGMSREINIPSGIPIVDTDGTSHYPV